MADITFDNKTHTFEDLEVKYRNFMAPIFHILIEGTNIVREGVAVTSITVETSVESEADSVVFIVNNAFDPLKREFSWMDKYFALGKSVVVKMGYTDKVEPIFYGVLTSCTVNFPAGGTPVLTVTAMDKSFMMMKGKSSESWNKKKYSDVAKEIGKKYLSKVVADDSGILIPQIEQSDQTDYEFLQWMAGQVHFDFFVIGKTMYFRKPQSNTAPVVTLMWGKTLMSMSVKMNIASQVSKVIVRGWDQKTQKHIEATSGDVKKLGSNSKTGKDIMKTLGEFDEHIYTNVVSKEEAQKQADAEMNKKAMKLVSGSGETIGLPEIRAGRYIKLDGLGKKMNQLYYLSRVTHTINSSGYTTKFNVQGNAV
jgi:phage protein D